MAAFSDWRKQATLEFPDVLLEKGFVRHVGASNQQLMRWASFLLAYFQLCVSCESAPIGRQASRAY